MNNTYIAEKYNIVDALNEMDSFSLKMKKFIEKHPEYNYNVSIYKKDNSWVIKLNVNNEQNN